MRPYGIASVALMLCVCLLAAAPQAPEIDPFLFVNAKDPPKAEKPKAKECCCAKCKTACKCCDCCPCKGKCKPAKKKKAKPKKPLVRYASPMFFGSFGGGCAGGG